MRSWLMKKNVRLALVVAVGLILTVGAVIIFGNDSDGKPGGKNSGTGSLPSSVSNGGAGLNEQGKPLPRRKTYPVGNWDIAIPYLNPFGSQNNYQSVDYLSNQYQELRYINQGNMETSRATSGEVWKLQVQWTEQNADPFDDLMSYISELGGDFYQGSQENSWVMHAADEQGTDWWAVASQSGAGYLLTVYKELKLQHGKTLTFNTEDYDNQGLYFMTNNETNHYQSIQVSLAEGQVQMLGKGAFEQGQYRRELYYSNTLYAYKTKDYTLNDIPQDTSAPILWHITWSKDSDPRELAFTLDEGQAISPIRDGERLGALKVRGSMLGEVKVQLPAGVTMRHPELNLKGDKTPEGDMLFWLPPGYWDITVDQPGSSGSAPSLNTRLIPVSTGEMTELDVKPLINNAYRSSELGDSSGEESQLKMESISEQGDTAKISFMLLDAQNPQFSPATDNIEILEGGQPGKIVKLERRQMPPSVVLALDSSGSMVGSMEQVLDSARTFIQGLPDNTHIQVIDFDSEVKLLQGTSKKEVLGSLSQVIAKGNTTLYDSIVEGLKLLKDQQRPTLVVFSDGVDSSAEKQGTGSKATKQEVERAVQASGIPLFTIGFGSGHDGATLLELAAMSEGTYYAAEDTTVLDHVFTSINDRLGNHFEVTYERPKEQAPSDVPVIALTMDVSGSMDVDPTSGNGDYRIDKVKHLFHDFIKQVPEHSLMQLMSFSTEINVDQVYSSRKPELLQALGRLAAGGGTDIYNSTAVTYQSLKKVPSDKRVIVYLTDAALDVEQSQRESFEKLLTGIKEEGIQVLWVGMGTAESEQAFQWAADKSGGRYVISEDPVVLAKAFQEVLAEVQQKPAEKVSLSLSITNQIEQGVLRQYSESQLVDFPARLNASDKAALNTISYEAGKKAAQYEAQTASVVYGSDIPSKDVKLYKRIPLKASGKNKAMEWTAREMYFLKRLRGVDAPVNRSFVAVEMELKNIHSEAAKYLIPDFASHFFISMNHTGAYPASTATWLSETPLAPPGEVSIALQPDESLRGILVFLVPDEKTEHASLHYYDTSNGHIALSLIGAAQTEELALSALPTSVTGRLSDTFDLTLKASTDMSKIGNVELTRKTSVFKVIEAELNSKLQADLKLDPQQRFYLNMKTGKGPFLIPVNTATALLPHGMLRPVTMGPGSSNKVRFAFQTPSALKDAAMELYVDLFGGAAVLPLADNGNAAVESGNGGGPVLQGDGVSLTVNSLARVMDIESSRADFVVADVTITDTKDGFGTSGFRETFTLVPGPVASGQEPVPQLRADPITDDLLLGIDSNWAVFDGTARRGLLVFSLPTKQADHAWTLQSALFSELKLPITKEAYKEDALLVKKVTPALDQKFDIELSTALAAAIREHRALVSANPTVNAVQTADFDDGKGRKQNVPAPLPTVHGLTRLKAVKTMLDFDTVLNGLGWLPSSDSYYYYRNAPESVLTQGWGSEGDLANLAGGLLAKLGYSPSLRMVKVTEDGRQALRELGGVDEVKAAYLPAWAYQDELGTAKVFVVPFMQDLSELRGLVFYPGGQEGRSMTPVQSTVSVYYQIEPKEDGGLGSMFGSIGGALGGEADSGAPVIQEVRVLEASLGLDQLGKEAVDIRAGGANGLYTAVMENQTLQILGKQAIDPNESKIVGVRIEVQLPRNKLVHETKLQDGQEISGVFHTLAINLPDVSAEAAEVVQKAADRDYKAASSPDDQSTLRWYTRNILYRFIVNQTAYENELANTLEVTAGRTDKERVIVVTVRGKDAAGHLRTSVDLQQSANMLHKGSEESRQGFNILSGLFASRLEGAVLPGNKADFMELWTRSPEDTSLFLSLYSNRQEDLIYMEERGYPEVLLARAKASTVAMLIPSQPTRIYGESRWAWLEIDPETYETIAVLDTGEHGSSAEYLISLEPVSPTGDDYLAFMAGAFIGVSSSVWSVSSFALKLDDYEDIIKAAKMYTYGLGEVLSGMMDNKDLVKLEYSMSPLKLKIVDKDFSYLAKHFEEVKLGSKGSASADVVGFALGFKSGAAYYFKQAEQAIKKAPKGKE